MNFEGLSKLTQFPYATALKLGEQLFQLSFAVDCVFSQVLRLDCVYSRILQCFHKSQGSIQGSSLQILVNYPLFSDCGFEKTMGFQQKRSLKLTNYLMQQSKMQLKRLENEDSFKTIKSNQIMRFQLFQVIGYGIVIFTASLQGL